MDFGNGTAGTANRGGGGGGGANGYGGGGNFSGGNGGSVIVIIRYPDTFANLTTIGGGLTYSLSTTGGFKIYSFTAGTGTVTI